MRAGGKRAVFNEINITPLTDIFLVLLIIMMVVAPMLDTSGLKLAVPSVGPSEDTKEQPKTIALTIDASGAYSVDGKALSLPELKQLIKQQKNEKPDGLVITTSPDASHDTLTQAMDAAQTAGVTKIAVTEGAGGGSTGASDEAP
jgi:biopolymer transport protein ExbD